MKDLVIIEDINALIITINTKFLRGKSKIGVRADFLSDTSIIIYQIYEGEDILTIEKNLSLIGAYCYLMGFMKGFTAQNWD